MDMEHSGQSHWIPLSDLMTGLMMIFMLLSALFMLRVEQTTTLVVQEHEKTKAELLRALQDTFKNDLKQWDAEFLGDMTLRFKNPDVMFTTGSANLKPQFKIILSSFYPRYMAILTDQKFKEYIKEIRIEGHTSSFWGTEDDETAYIHNMELSQSRTRSALEHILKLSNNKDDKKWMQEHLTANGLSSSKPIMKTDGKIDQLASQRVEFRIVTNAEERLENIALGISNDKF